MHINNQKQVRIQLVRDEEKKRMITIIQTIHEGEEISRGLSASNENNSLAFVRAIVDAGKQGYSFDKNNLIEIQRELKLDENFEDTCWGAAKTYAMERIRNYIPVM